ncbi:MAG: D-aminoacyl-tRNA deacylase [Chromatiales bacterium]
MIALIQRVSSASVHIKGKNIGQIGVGLLALIGIEQDDDTSHADKLLHKLLNYRVFEDDTGRMNLSLQAIAGGLLLVPQFTLAADTSKGLRPGFSTAAAPADGERLFHYLLQQAQGSYQHVSSGVFGADMQVSLVNEGPATFWLQS